MSSSTRANTRTSTVNTKKIALAALFTAASGAAILILRKRGTPHG